MNAKISTLMPSGKAVPQAMAVTAVEIEPGQRPALRRFRTWKRFHYGPRSEPGPLLSAIGRYPQAVFVAGCQRSGTTMLTRIIARSPGFRYLSLTTDDELDAALALCGRIELPAHARYCFQTTYLNERYVEYKMLSQDQRLVWVLRNPYSVVYSMVHNWKRFALNELYEGCCVTAASEPKRSTLPWPLGPSSIEKACQAYAVKTAQILSIRAIIPAVPLLVIDYDAMILDPHEWLGRVFAFIGAPYQPAYASVIRQDSVKKAARLTSRHQSLIRAIAEPTYRECLKIL